MTPLGFALDLGSVDESAGLCEFRHDLHNLLAVVITYAELVQQSLPDGHPAGAHMSEISAAGQRAVALVNTLASLSSPHD